MTEEVEVFLTQEQRDCQNVWHRRPGALLECPHCRLSRNALEKVTRSAVNGRHVPPVPDRNLPPPTTRVQLKLFEDRTPAIAISMANAWLTEVSTQPNVQVVNVSTHVHTNFTVVVAYTVS